MPLNILRVIHWIHQQKKLKVHRKELNIYSKVIFVSPNVYSKYTQKTSHNTAVLYYINVFVLMEITVWTNVLDSKIENKHVPPSTSPKPSDPQIWCTAGAWWIELSLVLILSSRTHEPVAKAEAHYWCCSLDPTVSEEESACPCSAYSLLYFLPTDRLSIHVDSITA